jgi:gamma-glutamylcyclotransferase (GGCT)/AIG2-like uncharacterized protein YtfP/cation transport regulator ChaC
VKVFVYGTLRKHEKYHNLLKKSHCAAEQAWTYGELFDTALGYPVMRTTEKSKVYGELYEVDEATLEVLDRLEDFVPGREENLYERIEAEIYTDLQRYTAFLYIEKQTGLSNIPISDGDWKLYRLLQTPPKNVYYFAYGSCMDVERFQKAKVEKYFHNVVGACKLDGYSMKYLFQVHDGGRADIMEDGGETEGILYEIPFEGVEYLFEREGFYSGWYRPTFVDVRIKDTLYPNVMTFHVYEKKEEQAPPSHYALEILRGAKGRVSEDYYQNLRMELKRLGVNYDFL